MGDFMDMEELIEECLKCLRLERKYIGKLLQSEEENNTPKFEGLKNYFRILKERTDILVNQLVDFFPAKEVIESLTSKMNFASEETLDELTLTSLVDSCFVNKLSDLFYNTRTDAVIEENAKCLYMVYLWSLDNGMIPEEIKTSLHRFMQIRLSSSRFIRSYYSGDIEEAENISNPDKSFGLLANKRILSAYNSLLNKAVNDANCFEMLEDITDENVFLARRKMIELEFVAICAQIQSRDIIIPVTENEMSDFTEGIVRSASTMSDEFNKRDKGKSLEKIIYL